MALNHQSVQAIQHLVYSGTINDISRLISRIKDETNSLRAVKELLTRVCASVTGRVRD